MPEVPSACRKVLFGSRAAGLLATDSVARRSSLSVTGRVLVTFLLICVSRSIYICRIDLLVLESMYLRFQTAPYLHCAALSLSSRRSLFMSYVLRRSVSSWESGCSMDAALFDCSIEGAVAIQLALKNHLTVRPHFVL